ncbi:MAG TPA: PadR family transcriptional regulator [Thermomicrobiales bacterium]|nr:PadR family transcriptional regulator [Thermomicrobiales bacterium]
MFYELLALARLMEGPQHGYLIAKVASDISGPWTKVSPGTLYPVLARLVEAGLIREVGGVAASRREPRAYAITAAGRARFRELMLDTTADRGDYQRRFHLKVPSLAFLAPEERRRLFDHYGEYCRTAITYLEKEARLLQEHGPASGAISAAGIAAAVDLLAHQADQWRAELTWVERLRARLAPPAGAAQETAPEGPSPAARAATGSP